MATSSFVGVLLMAGAAFLGLSPQFGGKPTKADKQAYAKSGHYQDGEFVNLVPTLQLTEGSITGILWKFLFKKAPNTSPAGPLPMQPLDSLAITRKTPDMVRVTWFGHSASLVELAGKTFCSTPCWAWRWGR